MNVQKKIHTAPVSLSRCVYISQAHKKKCTHKIHYKVFYTISPTVLYIHQMYWQCTDRKVPASHLFFTIFVTHKHTHTDEQGQITMVELVSLCFSVSLSLYHVIICFGTYHIPHKLLISSWKDIWYHILCVYGGELPDEWIPVGTQSSYTYRGKESKKRKSLQKKFILLLWNGVNVNIENRNITNGKCSHCENHKVSTNRFGNRQLYKLIQTHTNTHPCKHCACDIVRIICLLIVDNICRL